MPKMNRSHRTLIALLPVFLIVSACGRTAPKAATELSGELKALLPDDIREAGVIKTGGPVTEAPTLYLEEDATTRTGYMTDLANAVGNLLGVEIEHTEMPFPALVPGLQRGSIDMTLTIIDKNGVETLFRAGRYDLLRTSFETFEHNIRAQLGAMLG
jgi:ABC-type amino acid transport substrate-binding protein